MARKTVRVDIPDGSPEELLTLIGKIFARSAALAAASPLHTMEGMADRETAHGLARDAQTAGDDAAALAQQKHNLAKLILGIGEGQTSTDQAGLLFFLLKMRDQLLVAFRGNEEALTEWGFNVVIGTAASPHPHTP